MIYRNGKLITEVHQNIRQLIDQVSQLTERSIGAIYKQSVKRYNDDPCNAVEPEIYINELLYADTNEKFDINIYDMIKESYEKEIQHYAIFLFIYFVTLY